MLRGGHLRHPDAASRHSTKSSALNSSSVARILYRKRAQTSLSICAKFADLRFRKARKEDIPVLRRMIFQER